MRINVRFAGSGGQGVIMASVLLAKSYGIGENYFIAQTQSYGPEARGGACKAEVVVSDEEIDYMKVDKADVFVALNQVGYDKYIHTVDKDAIVLVNSTLVDSDDPRHYHIEATELAEKMGKPFVVNIIALGALTKLLPKVHFPAVEEEIKKIFKGDMGEMNMEAYRTGYNAMDRMLWQEERNTPSLRSVEIPWRRGYNGSRTDGK